MTIKHLCVLIPAKDEEQLLSRCLNSIFAASTAISYPITLDIILCVDSSTDRTLEIGKSMLNQRGLVIETNKANVGFARKYAAAHALQRYTGPLECCWIANTDADCEVPLNWLQHQLDWANEGVQGLAGIVKVDSYQEHDEDVPELFQKEYLIYPNGSHPHVHGANLGIRADVYKEIGGWNELPTAEDHDLWNRLKSLDTNVISNADFFVNTSGRKLGRAPDGFANRLASFNRKNT